MGKRRLAFSLTLIAILFIRFNPAAQAFHDGGTGDCDECHEVHTSGEYPDERVLRGSDASSTCLRCHAKMGEPYNVLSDDGSSFTAGGDFFWLQRSYTWTENGRSHTSPGDRHGHNVVAADYNLHSDASFVTGPGGQYMSSNLSCTSCHDPHRKNTGGESITGSGSYEAGDSLGDYRLLAGVGYTTNGTLFTNPPPVALSPTYWGESDENHVDYGSGMSEWCGNCHGAMVSGMSVEHPSGEFALFTNETATAYASYLRTGDFSGSADSSFLALVPFERGVSDPSMLDPTSTSGPESKVSNVMCLTCHRAHGSAFEAAGRWDFSATFLANSHPGPNTGGAGAMNSYYGRDIVAEFGEYQRSLCDKCHPED